MKKCRKKIYCILLTTIVMCATILSSYTTANAAMSKSEQHKLYKTTMKNYVKKVKAAYKRNSPEHNTGSSWRKENNAAEDRKRKPNHRSAGFFV